LKHHNVKIIIKSLEDEGDDGLAPRVILELLQVVPVFSESPESHLVTSSQGEQSRRKTLGHQSEAKPSPDLISVVRT